ncbi:hypothetical protein IQ07DRAFT_603496 [Pyrenochaeta sp. DS3sAY3a]|nr:hypothetical protein IQ07DRAFT_603496 [Pyrenochaeta sp. DS3sAY3a]
MRNHGAIVGESATGGSTGSALKSDTSWQERRYWKNGERGRLGQGRAVESGAGLHSTWRCWREAAGRGRPLGRQQSRLRRDQPAMQNLMQCAPKGARKHALSSQPACTLALRFERRNMPSLPGTTRSTSRRAMVASLSYTASSGCGHLEPAPGGHTSTRPNLAKRLYHR